MRSARNKSFKRPASTSTQFGFWSKLGRFSFTFIFLLGAASASAELVYPALTVFPGQEWATSTPAASGWDAEKFKTLENFLFSTEQFSTDSFLVISGGKLVFERYARDYTPTMRHFAWSVSKSVSMALLGIAAQDGRVALADPVSKHVSELKNSLWDQVTVEQLLAASSGVKWDEGYESSPFKSDVVAALYRSEISKDFAGYREKIRKQIAKPGTRLVYSSGDTNLSQLVLKRILGEEQYANYPWERLFGPLGMTSAVLERDAAGTFVGSSYLHATPRDMARFGYLFLRDGKWSIGGKIQQLVAPEWAKIAGTPSAAEPNLKAPGTTHEPYGHGWWINKAYPELKMGRSIPDFPEETYWAEGHEGQFVFVIPAWDLVMVRLGCDRKGKKFDPVKFGKLVSEARMTKVGAK